MAPAAVPDDGRFEICLVKDLSKPAFLRAFPSVFQGKHGNHPAVSFYQAARVRVSSDSPLVVHADGENYLSVPGALVRVLGYALSSVFLSLGFLMALFTRNNRALHDYISQSRVISVKQRGEMGDGLVLALSWAIMAILIGSWGKQAFVKPNPEETAQIMAARTTVNKLATLEEIHKAKYNAYTDDIKRLAFLTRTLEAVRRELAKNLAPDTLAIASDGRVYIITAQSDMAL